MKKYLCLMLSFVFILFTSSCSCNNDEQDNEVYEMKSIVVPMVKAYKSKDIDGAYTYVSPFDTAISLNYFKEEDIKNIESYFKDEFVRLHMLFDRHYYYYDNEGNLINNLRIINESNGEEVSVDQDLINIFKEGIRFTKLSNGKFNIGIGNLSDLWNGFISFGGISGIVNLNNVTTYEYVDGQYIESTDGNYIQGYGIYVDINNYDRSSCNEETKECVKDINGTYIEIDASAPSEEQINQAKACLPSHLNIEDIIVIDDENNTIKINEIEGCCEKISITLGALAKSYAAEKIASNDNFKGGNYLLNAGQSTIKLIGENLSRESREWRVGITDSHLVYKNYYSKYASYMLTLKGSNNISTSSGDEKHYFYRNNYYHHIIDPITGYPNQNRFAITAVGKNAMYVDIITTALMSMNMEETKSFINDLLEQNIDVEIFIQDKSNDTVKTYATNNIKNNLSIRFNEESLKDYLNSIAIEELVYES